MFKETGNLRDVQLLGQGGTVSRKMVIAVILGVALIAFEIFNFDTTQYALRNLLGDIRFAGVLWASILAIAFCAIDFAGLVRLFTPQRGAEEPRAVWFLTGAWFLGTIANAVMTWWAVSLTLLNHPLGNEVMSREQLLKVVPLFVAILVWMTRILFIGSLTAAGEKILYGGDAIPTTKSRPYAQPASQPVMAQPTPPARQPVLPSRPIAAQPTRPAMQVPQVQRTPEPEPMPQTRPQRPANTNNNRVRQRPPGPIRPNVGGLSASPRNRN